MKYCNYNFLHQASEWVWKRKPFISKRNYTNECEAEKSLRRGKENENREVEN